MCSSRLEPKWSYRTEGTTPARAAMSCIFAAVVAPLGEDLHRGVEDADAPFLGRYPLSCHTE